MVKRRKSERAGKTRDQDTISLANELLAKNDIVGLRKLAAIRGLVTHGLRSRVWPLLLGTHEQAHDEQSYAERQARPHRDAAVVRCDMERSLWTWTEGWSDDARAAKRASLQRILDAVVAGNSTDLHYYQGLHDVAGVLLFVAGEPAAYRMLQRLATCHLRDCTRATLDATLEALALLYPILEAADPELYTYITSLNEPALEVPFFALSWHMTWFSHDVPGLDACARLFDLFISSHPLMPLYVAAVAVRAQREAILACGPGAGDAVYATLKGLQIFGEGRPDADQLAREAAALYRAAPPAHLLRKLGDSLRHSTTLFAYVEGGRWEVPAEAGGRRRRRGLPPLRALPSPPAALAQVLPVYLGGTPRGMGGSGRAADETRRRQKAERGQQGGGRGRGGGTRNRRGGDALASHPILGGVGRRAPLQGVAALTAMVFTGLAGAAFLGTTIVLSQLHAMGVDIGALAGGGGGG